VTDATQEAALVGVATLLQTVAGGGALFGPDKTSLQTKLMKKDSSLKAEDAASKADKKLKKYRAAWVIVWIIAIIAAAAAVVLVLST
jgi:hypothetical protein